MKTEKKKWSKPILNELGLSKSRIKKTKDFISLYKKTKDKTILRELLSQMISN